MSEATVTAAIQAFLAPTAGITKLYKAPPLELTGDNWQTNSLPGTPAFLHMEHKIESRITVPANHGGQKQVDYTFALMLLYQYDTPTAMPSQDSWADGLVALTDAVTDRIRSDPAFNSGGVIFEAGNQDGGIEIHKDFPHWDKDSGKVRNWLKVAFKVTEIVTV
jgi:hypothetical protein